MNMEQQSIVRKINVQSSNLLIYRCLPPPQESLTNSLSVFYKNLLCVFFFLLLPVFGLAEETFRQKTRNILNDKTVEDPYKRWEAAIDTVKFHFHELSFDEGVALYNKILLPFVEKEIKDESKRNIAQAYIYADISLVYEEKGKPEDFPVVEKSLTKALGYAEKSGDKVVLADIYLRYGKFHSLAGCVQLAHEYFYKAINIYESLNYYDNISACLVRIGESLMHIRDIAGLRKVIEKMQDNLKKQPNGGTPYSLFRFYKVQGAYYSILSEDHPEVTAFKDSVLAASRNTIRIMENHSEVVPLCGFEYYNMALAYSSRYSNRYDSIYYFLDKALDCKTGDKYWDIELEIAVYTLYAELHFEQKRYGEAERDMLHVLSLLEQVKEHNWALVDFAEACKFMVKYYETMNRPNEAIEYYKLLSESEQKRYDKDKIAALNDMLVKHEVEKKTERIERLTEEKRTQIKILTLAVIIIVSLSVLLLVLRRLHKLKRKNFEQRVYESALVAELKQNELDAELGRIKQHLEQKPVKTMIGKLTGLITKSIIEQTKKEGYIRQLSELDIDMLEKGFLTSNEKLSNMDMKYLLCFAIDMKVKDMCLIFNVESASIYMVRYRIKKKFGANNSFNFLM